MAKQWHALTPEGSLYLSFGSDSRLTIKLFDFACVVDGDRADDMVALLCGIDRKVQETMLVPMLDHYDDGVFFRRRIADDGTARVGFLKHNVLGSWPMELDPQQSKDLAKFLSEATGTPLHVFPESAPHAPAPNFGL